MRLRWLEQSSRPGGSMGGAHVPPGLGRWEGGRGSARAACGRQRPLESMRVASTRDPRHVGERERVGCDTMGWDVTQ